MNSAHSSYNFNVMCISEVSKLALGTLLKRCQEVLKNYVKDEKLSGRCPLPRSRMAEIAFVMQAITSLITSLQARRSVMTHGKLVLNIIT